MTAENVTPSGLDLTTELNDAAGLHALLSDPDVKNAAIAELRDLDVPFPGLVYRCIVFAAGRSEKFVGGVISSRLQAFIDRQPKIATMISRITNLYHGARAKDVLKADLVQAIREGRPVKASIDVDDTTSLDFAIALHSVQKLDELDAAIAALGKDFIRGFQDDIARLSHDIFRPQLSWPQSAVNKAELTAFDRLKYTSGLDTFVGREKEIDLLTQFAGDPSFGGRLFNFRWMLMTGDGGMGKTRLAYHFTKNNLASQWDADKIDIHNLEAFNEPEKWWPKQPTFIVIDYAQNAPAQINRLLTGFSRQAANYEFPVRLLLLERAAEETWTSKLLPQNADRPTLLEHNFAGSGIGGEPLSPIMPWDIIKMMTVRFETQELAAPPPRQTDRSRLSNRPKNSHDEYRQ